MKETKPWWKLFFILIEVFADEKQREIYYEAINLIIKKYGKGLENW